jgi:hypothetical protein
LRIDDDAPVHDLGTNDEDDSAFEQSSTEDRAAVLAEAVAHAATQEAHYKQPGDDAKRPSPWKVPLALVVFVLSAYLMTFPPPWLAGEDPPAVSQSAREHGVKAALFLQAQQIEAFRARQGRLPGTLEETTGAMAGIQFVRSNSRVFQLLVPGPDGPGIIYDSSRPIDEFVSAAAGWGVNKP